MLGRLSTWLRLIGYDCDYLRDLGDHVPRHAAVLGCEGRLHAPLVSRSRTEAVRLHRAGGRIVLTRDVELFGRLSRPSSLWVESDRVMVQLVQVCRDLGLEVDPKRMFSRCLRCNEPVAPIDKTRVLDRVPPYVYATQERFRECPACGRLYWAATHKRSAEESLRSTGLL